MTQITPPATVAFAHHGTVATAVRLGLGNALLNIVTLGFWRFWGKTRVRRFLWNHTTVWGDPVEYTGTGKELFIGFLVVGIAVLSPYFVLQGTIEFLAMSTPALALLGIPLNLALFTLIGAGLFRARRYQLSRTVWRGIRGGQDGSALTYGALWLGTTVLGLVTLGLAWPWCEVTLARYRLSHTLFGDQRFACDAKAGPLYRRFAVVWLAALPYAALAAGLFSALQEQFQSEDPTAVLAAAGTLYAGLVVGFLALLAVPFAWYKAGYLAHVAAHTRFGDTRFRADLRTWPLIGLAVGNYLITLLSLGALGPWAALRTFRTFCRVVAVVGEPDWTAVHQSAERGPKTGEGILSVFDGGGEF